MLWAVIIFITLAIAFYCLARSWNSQGIHDHDDPLVSILIPAYKSEKTIERCLQSIKRLDYKKKEVIVVNDYPDRTPEITRKFGHVIINSDKRRGKSISLNEAVKKSKGSILFFMDSDTIISKNCLHKVIPWFSAKGVGVVAPRYVAMNRKGLVPRLVSLENSYNSTMFRMHMRFGSMVSFRGCGIAISRRVFEEMGGWSETLIEDTDFAAKVTHAGYKIQYEPSAVVETYEPDSISSLKRQKLRWGRGAGFAIFNNREAYANSLPALSQFLPYVFLNLAILYSFLMGIGSYLPLAVEGNYAAFSVSSMTYTLLVLGYLFAGVSAHNFIIMFPERRKWTDALYVPLYTLIYLPVVLVCYVGGIALGIADRLRHKKDLDLNHW
jgi:cellulose synthase/poly-beta-1,6-N-acetylglucosamine synthase-like glycosyltransferase